MPLIIAAVIALMYFGLIPGWGFWKTHYAAEVGYYATGMCGEISRISTTAETQRSNAITFMFLKISEAIRGHASLRTATVATKIGIASN